MDTASLLAAAWFSLAGLTGWQPDPDADGFYLVTIHVDDAAAAALRERGRASLPLDLPADIAPVSRVRIEHGAAPVVRRRMMTLYKPELPADAKLTQAYTPAPGGDRYGTTPGFDPYAPVTPAATAPTPGSYPASAAAATSPWPTTAAQPSTAVQPWAPAASQTATQFGQSAVDQASRAAGDAAADWQRQLEAQARQATGPISDGLQQIDDRLRTAIDSFGDRAGSMFDVQTQPLNGQGLMRPEAVPPLATSPSGSPWAVSPQSTVAFPQGNPQAGNSAAWPTVPASPTPAAPWTGVGGPTPAPPLLGSGQTSYDPRLAATSAPTPASGGLQDQDAIWSSASARQRAPSDVQSPFPTGAQPPGAAVARDPVGRPIDPRDVGRWNVSNVSPQPPAATSRSSSQVVDVSGAGASRGATSAWPSIFDQPAAESSGGPASASPWPESSSATTPTTTSDIFSNWDKRTAPGDGVVRTAAQPARTAAGEIEGPTIPGLTGGGSAPSATPPTSPFDRPANESFSPFDGVPLANPAGSGLNASEAPNGGATSAASQIATNPQTSQSTPPLPASAATAGPRNTIPVVVAWVLLFGSAAGNAYMLWSYLEVRTKYRTLVRRNGQGVRSRYSPA